jgi:hypothetical protein
MRLCYNICDYMCINYTVNRALKINTNFTGALVRFIVIQRFKIDFKTL